MREFWITRSYRPATAGARWVPEWTPYMHSSRPGCRSGCRFDYGTYPRGRTTHRRYTH